MAHPVAHQTSSFAFGGVAHTLVARFKSAYAKQTAYRRTMKELSQLTDRELADIGVARSMIHDIAMEEAERF